MKVFLPDFLSSKNTVPKKIVLLLPLLCCLYNVNAQVLFRIEPGFLIENESKNLGLLLNIEPKVQISENSIIGLRFGIALNSQKFKNIDNSQFLIDNQDNYAVISFVPTYDYFFNKNKYRPYLGLGLGYYLLFDDLDVLTPNGSREVIKGSTKNQLGVLLRGGLEVGNIRCGLEYNLINKADIEMPNGQKIGNVNNNYLGLSIGFIIGRKKN